ncbi:MAG: hypothetical protein OEO77_06260, partial [Acidimicrobiia bacterium]|nr:hypothetical protein [Acidimicrobiia bacterium]
RRAAFGGNVLLGVCVFFVLAAVPLFVATLIETDGRQAAWLAGWLLTVFTGPLALTVWLTSRWTRRSWLVLGGMPAVAGFGLMRWWQPTAGSLVPALVVLGVSLGWWFTPLAEIPLRASPAAAAGGVSSLVLLARLVGMAIGTNLLVGVIVAAIGRIGALEGVDVQAEVLDVFRSASWLGVVAAGLLVVAGGMATRQKAHPAPL